MKNMLRSLFWIISFNISAQGPVLQTENPSAVKVSPQRLTKIDRLLQSEIDSGFIKGAVGFVARDGKVIYFKAIGLDDIDKKTPLKTDAIFRIGSQSKAITCAAAMTLYEEGKFLLDDPVAKYIPDFANLHVLDKFNIKDTTYTTKPAKRAITIRDLLTNTSGIDYSVIGSDTMKAIYAKAKIPFISDPITLSDAMNRLSKLPLRHQPGERFTYGLNAEVLGYLIEVVSKMSLDQFLRVHIFEPLGMEDTYFYLPPSKYSRLVNVYTKDDKNYLRKWREKDWPYSGVNYPAEKGTYFAGGGGLSSTVKDYAVFLQMLLNGGEYNGQRILSKHTIALMTSNQIGDTPWSSQQFALDRWGFGFATTTKAGQTRLGQSEGSFEWAGIFNTYFWVDPKEKLVCLLYTQQFPFSWHLMDKYKVAVYQALDD